ncbi:armadillo-type protein [Parasitella parasitica]|nr:armadillo-type protein [Parasitella parasitica]
MDIDDTQSSGLIDSQMETEEAPRLEFSESLIGTPKPIKVGELQTLLKSLHEQLKELDQNVDQSSLETVTRELVHKQIIKNPNKTVKALAACCIADIIRLHAPTCPYSLDELKNVFKFFVDQLGYFGKETPDFPYHFYLLENLQSVKTFLLLSEIDGSEDIVFPMVAEFFEVASKATLRRNVELCMTDVLIQLIEDVGILGQEMTELILEQFERFEKGSTNPAFVMTLDICYVCTSSLQRRVCQYFSDILLSMSNTTDQNEDLEEIRKAHHLMRKINSIAPDLLLNAMPLLQEEMKVDHLNIRQLATETMGEMFAEESSNVAEKYPNIWKTWLGRRNDKAQSLRVKWLYLCVDIYKNHPESVPELIECLKEKFTDPDDKVRLTACKVVGEIGIENDSKIMDKNLVELVGARAKDKKNLVRVEAMTTIGTIYDNCYQRIKANDKLAIEKTGWIPDLVLSCLYLGDLAVQANVEAIFQTFIVPENDNDAERTERLVTVLDSLKDKQKIAFLALLQKQKLFNENMLTFVEMCEKNIDHSETTEHDATKVDEFIKYLAARFSDKARTLNALRSFLHRENDRDIKLLRNAIDLNRTYKQVNAAKTKLLSNLKDDQSAIVDIFQAILNRACPLILNKSNITHLLKIAKTNKSRRATASSQRSLVAQKILSDMSTVYPSMYTNNLKDIISDIMNDNDSTADEGLQLLSEISKASVGEMKFQDNLVERLTAYVSEGSVEQAKHAATALAAMKNADLVLVDSVTEWSDDFFINSSALLSRLASFSQFALYAPALIDPLVGTLIRFVQDDLLSAKTKEFNKKNDEWEPYNDLPQLSKQKLAGVRLLVNYLIASKDSNQLEDFAISKIFSILWELMDVTCESALADKTNAAETSHLRLGASQSIVKLTQFSRYMSELTVPKFEKLSTALQDACYYVRQEFAESLMKGLQSGQIHSRYYTLLFICAHEPEISLLKQVKSFIQKRLSVVEVKQGESSVVDSSLVRLIHLLAHHPDFTEAVEDLNDFSQYFRFFISCVATPDNVSFLYHIAQQIKISKDMVDEELSKNSYILSDLACLLIKTKCKDASWPLDAFGGRVSLQSRLYRTLPAGAVQAETIKKNYLPKEFLTRFEEEHKHKSGEKVSSAIIPVP